jgi:ParB family chromosome partitioning protein
MSKKAKKDFAPSIFANIDKAKSDVMAQKIEGIDIDELHSSPDNFFEVTDIEQFAETVKGQGGIKENLIVKGINEEEGGGYEIISGHRRTAAIRYLLEQGETISRLLPCYIANYEDDDEKRLNIVLMNVTSRIISDAEMWKSYETVNSVLQNKKKLGEKFGQIRVRLAEILNVSTGKVSMLENISHNASDEIKSAVSSGKMSIFAADKETKQGEKVANIGNFSEETTTPHTSTSFSEKQSSAKKNEKQGEKVANIGNFSEENTLPFAEQDEPSDGGLSDFQLDYLTEKNDDYGDNDDTITYAKEPKVEKIITPLPRTEHVENITLDVEKQEKNAIISVTLSVKQSNIAILKEKRATLQTLVDLYISNSQDDEKEILLRLKGFLDDIDEMEINEMSF